MDFSFSPDQQEIRDTILKHCSRFPDEYWLERDREGTFPENFYRSLAEAGWLGIAMPTRYGGAGLGITEAAIMMQAIAESGAGMSGASAVHINIFGLQRAKMASKPATPPCSHWAAWATLRNTTLNVTCAKA